MDAKQPALTEQLHSSNGSVELVLSAVLFGLIGLWIDSKTGTTPIFLLVFTFLGFAGAATSVYYRYRNDIARLESQRDAVRAEALQAQALAAQLGMPEQVASAQPRTTQPRSTQPRSTQPRTPGATA